MFKNVDGVVVEMTAEEEDEFLAGLPSDPPRSLDDETFLAVLENLGEYDNFLTWLSSQANAVKIIFNKRRVFYETDSHVTTMATALSITIEDIFGIGT